MAQVQSLVGEVRSRKPLQQPRAKKRTERKRCAGRLTAVQPHVLLVAGARYGLTRCCGDFTESHCFCSVTQSCPTLCDPMDCSTPGLPVLHRLPGLAQTHVHRVGDAIQPSQPLSSPSPPAFNLSQHLGLFPMSQLSPSGGQSIRASASASVLPMNI